jgi:hypothetical protein
MENNTSNWLKKFCEDFNCSNDTKCTCEVNRCYNHDNLKKLNKKHIENFYKIGSKSIKCDHHVKNDYYHVCKKVSNSTISNSHIIDNSSTIEHEIVITKCPNEVDRSTFFMKLLKNLKQRYSTLIIITFLFLFLKNETIFEIIFIKNSEIIFLISFIILVIIFNNSQVFKKQKCYIIKTLKMIKCRYFNDNLCLFSLSAIGFGIISIRILFKIFLNFCNCFYYIIPKSKYFYLSNIIGHIISFDYPELIEYHDKYFYGIPNQVSC